MTRAGAVNFYRFSRKFAASRVKFDRDSGAGASRRVVYEARLCSCALSDAAPVIDSWESFYPASWSPYNSCPPRDDGRASPAGWTRRNVVRALVVP